MKKVIAIILSLIVVFSFAITSFASNLIDGEYLAEENWAEEDVKEDNNSISETKTYNYLLLGDSIAYGAGILNPNEACYGKMVCNTNGYNYKNDAIKGYDSSNLKSYLNNATIQQDIINADIIDISIGGNDIIRAGNYIWMIMCAAFGNYQPIQNVANDFTYPNFCYIISKIKELNPNATILVQTIYNPRMYILKNSFGAGVDIINSCFYKYLEENPGAYTIVNVNGALKNQTGFMAIDTIHPNGKGNILIAKEVLKTLKSLGLGESAEPIIAVTPVDIYAFPVYWIYKMFAVELIFN